MLQKCSDVIKGYLPPYIYLFSDPFLVLTFNIYRRCCPLCVGVVQNTRIFRMLGICPPFIVTRAVIPVGCNYSHPVLGYLAFSCPRTIIVFSFLLKNVFEGNSFLFVLPCEVIL